MCSVAPSSGGEDPQLALGTVDRLVEEAVGVLERDLPVVLAVRDQERAGDLLDDTVERLTASDMVMNSCRSVSPHTHITWSQ